MNDSIKAMQRFKTSRYAVERVDLTVGEELGFELVGENDVREGNDGFVNGHYFCCNVQSTVIAHDRIEHYCQLVAKSGLLLHIIPGSLAFNVFAMVPIAATVSAFGR